MKEELAPYGLTRPQFGVLSVLVADPGLSAADLARSAMVTPQAMNLVIGGLQRQGLVRREQHPTHGRVLQLYATDEGVARVRKAYPAVEALEATIAAGLSDRQLAAVKRWLVDVAQRVPKRA